MGPELSDQEREIIKVLLNDVEGLLEDMTESKYPFTVEDVYYLCMYFEADKALEYIDWGRYIEEER